MSVSVSISRGTTESMHAYDHQFLVDKVFCSSFLSRKVNLNPFSCKYCFRDHHPIQILKRGAALAFYTLDSKKGIFVGLVVIKINMP